MLGGSYNNCMPYKQKSRLHSGYEWGQGWKPLLSRERELVHAWQCQRVNESYQSIVLSYLDGLDRRDLSIEIQKELQRLHNKSSYFHKIEYLGRERERALDLLYQLTEEMNLSSLSDSRLAFDLQTICECLDRVRKASMLISEHVWEMFECFRFNAGKRGEAALGRHYISLFQHFDEDLQFLKRSMMKYYICFSERFDPLLLEAAKPLKRFYSEKKIVYNEHVDELFRTNASYLYRLLRAHQRITAYYTLSKELEATQHHTHLLQYSPRRTPQHYYPPQPQSNSSQQGHQAQRQPPSNAKKQKKLLDNIQYSERKANRERAMAHILSPTLADSMETRQEPSDGRYSQEAARRARLPAQPSREKPKDNRRITRIAEITIHNSKGSPRTPAKRAGKSRLSVSEDDMPERLVSTNPSKREPPSSLSQNKRTVTQSIEPKHSKPSSQNQFLQDHSPRSHRDPAQNTPLGLSPSLANHREIRQIRRKLSRNMQLPKLAEQRAPQGHSHDQSSDCLCRQKYKSRRLNQSCVGITAEEAEEKRQTIVRKVNEKYKELARKEIRYELSMLGDLTYHRMKDKVLKHRPHHNHTAHPHHATTPPKH